MSSVSTTMLAHQGGWDEALFVAVPMIIVVVMLKLAKRRMDAAAESTTAESMTAESTGSGLTHDAGANGGEATDEVLVTPVDVVDPGDGGLAVGGQPGDHHRRPGADVVGLDGRS